MNGVDGAGGAGGAGSSPVAPGMPADGAGAVTGSGAGGGASNPTTDDETPPDEPDPATLGDGGPDVGVIGSEGADGGASTVLPGCEPPTQYANLFESHLDRSRAEVDAKVEGAFQQLFHGGSNQTIYYESGDGAYILDVNSNDIRSEGQSYGMMVAVQLDKKEEFDRIWRWTARVMQQASGRIGWQASTSGQLYSSGSAPDGEEYIATALIFASTRWGDDTGINYAEEATRVLAAMYDEGLFDHEQQLVKFVTTSNYTDPSYILPTFYEVWACFDGEAERAAFWKAAAETGRAFFPKTVNSSTGLAPYLANWDGGARGDFNADSYRVVANIMMDHNLYKVDPWQTSFAETYAAFFEDAQQSSNPGAEFRLDGSVIAAYGAPEPALAAQNAMVAFGVPVEQGRYFVEYLWDMDIPSGQYRYYSGCLYMLSLLHVGGLFHLYH